MDDLRPRLEQALRGSYAFEGELGGGGMSRTYLATEIALNRQVVIKVLAPELLAGISVERFRREILLAAALQHPHVVPVLTAGEADGMPWFTMPYVAGNSLRQRLGRGSMGVGEAVGILRDVARALAFAHGRGVVHRDIKPDNVLLSEGSATVTDFGIAKALAASQRAQGDSSRDFQATLTQLGTSIGTPAYMAPEQALGDPDTDHRADLYAFGVMAYEMLAGRPPFQGSNPSKILAAHLGEPPTPIGDLAPGTPASLAELVMQCLEKDPERRPQEATHLVRVLDNVTTSGTGNNVPAVLRGGQIPLARAFALWAVATALVVVTAWAARAAIGLPNWALPGAIGVMLAGLPVILFTAYVQRTTHRAFTMTPGSSAATHGTMATLALKASPHLSWKRAWTGGALAVGGFGVLVIGFMVLRALGIGPMGSLKGKGIFGDHETLVVADFQAPASDSMLGMTVAEALRTDLAQSRSLDVLTRTALREQLTLMRLPTEARIPFQLAQEIAQREGAKAILDGQVTQLGGGYVIAASLIATLDGAQLATFREVADDEDGLIAAIGRLGKAVRERAGESLREIQATRELERVTTGSLAALRKYVEGNRLASEEGLQERGLELIEEAVGIDSTFAMAWRKIAIIYSNINTHPERRLEALSKAYRFRTNLTEEERLLTEGSYFNQGPEPDPDKALAAYDALLAIDSMNGVALNNSSIILQDRREWARAEERARRATELERTFGAAFRNRMVAQIALGRDGAALDSTVALYEQRLPGATDTDLLRVSASWGKGDVVAADSIARAVGDASPVGFRRSVALSWAADFAEMQGRPAASLDLRARSRASASPDDPGPVLALLAGLDSATQVLLHDGDVEGARAILARWLGRVPLASIPPLQRPHARIATLASLLQDRALLREMVAGWEADGAPSDPYAATTRAWLAVYAAMAESRWADARRLLDAADRMPGSPARFADAVRGQLADRLQQPDSALAAYRRLVDSREIDGNIDAYFRPQGLLRLGELYEARGDTTRAVAEYGAFVELWRNAEPAQQAKVREIRDRIARLNAARG